MRMAALIALAAAAFLGALAARAPLSAALALSGARDAGLDWRAAEGSVWDGTVRGLRLYDYDLGEAQVALRPLSLLTLSPSADLVVAGPEGRAEARLTVTPGGGLRVAGGMATVRLAELAAVDPRLRTRGGAFRARDIALALDGDGACRRASGALSTDALTYGFGGDWRGPALAGGLACEDGALVMSLAGAEEGEAVEATARLGDGAYAVEVILNSQHQDVARLAPVIGFAPYGEGWRYRWRFAP